MYGNVPGRLANFGDTLSADAVGVVTQASCRMPSQMLEFRWRPNDGDQMYIDANTDTPGVEFARRGALALVWKGIPVSTGLRIRMVAVYEYIPDVSQGIVNPTTSRSFSKNTLDHVVNVLDKAANWASSNIDMVGSFANLAMATGAVAYGGQRRAAIRI
jgi:hypothetical protein